MQFGTGRASTGGLHPQMSQLTFADLAAERLLHAPPLGRRGCAEAMRQVLLQTEAVDELDGAAAVAGGDEGVGVGGLQTDAALLGLPTGQQRPISHINKFQPVPSQPSPPLSIYHPFNPHLLLVCLLA
jgi:hypothetical protein